MQNGLTNKAKFAISSLFFLNGFVFATFAGRIPSLKEQIHLSDISLGILLIYPTLGSILGLFVAGVLTSKFGSRKAATFSVFAYLFTLFLLGMFNNVIALSTILIFFGISGNCLNISMNTQAVYFEKKNEVNTMSFFHAIFSIGGIAGALICNIFIFLETPIKYHFICVPIFCTILIGVTLKSLLSTHDHIRNPSFSLSFRKSILILGIISCCTLLIEGAVSDWSGVFLKNTIPDKPEYSNLGYTVYFSTMTLGRLTANRFGKYLKKKMFIVLVLLVGFVRATYYSSNFFSALYIIWICNFRTGIIMYYSNYI